MQLDKVDEMINESEVGRGKVRMIRIRKQQALILIRIIRIIKIRKQQALPKISKLGKRREKGNKGNKGIRKHVRCKGIHRILRHNSPKSKGTHRRKEE